MEVGPRGNGGSVSDAARGLDPEREPPSVIVTVCPTVEEDTTMVIDVNVDGLKSKNCLTGTGRKGRGHTVAFCSTVQDDATMPVDLSMDGLEVGINRRVRQGIKMEAAGK